VVEFFFYKSYYNAVHSYGRRGMFPALYHRNNVTSLRQTARTPISSKKSFAIASAAIEFSCPEVKWVGNPHPVPYYYEHQNAGIQLFLFAYPQM
jgi:hypothetical protein